MESKMTNNNNGIKLTEQEKKIVQLIRRTGGNTKILATELKISPRTLESHLKNIHLKTNTHSYSQIVIFAYENPHMIEDLD